MLKLIDLNFQMTGTGNLNELSFDCPDCGAPYRITIHARLNGPAGTPGIWSWKVSDPEDQESITVTPSIHNHNHGKRKGCNCHIAITNGQVCRA